MREGLCFNELDDLRPAVGADAYQGLPVVLQNLLSRVLDLNLFSIFKAVSGYQSYSFGPAENT
jgi:hypothetical protein